MGRAHQHNPKEAMSYFVRVETQPAIGRSGKWIWNVRFATHSATPALETRLASA